MAVIGVHQPNLIAPQPVATDIQPNPQDQRVADASKGVFQRFKETVSRVWSAAVIGIQTAGDKISFVVFRILEWVHPSLGPKIENVYLRVTNIWQAMKDAWRQEEIRREIENLRVNNHELQVRTRDYDHITQQNGQLQQENRELIQAKNFAEEALRGAALQERNIIGREQAVVGYRDVVVVKNQELEQANAQLILERDQAKQSVIQFIAANQELRDKLAQAQQQAVDLQVLLPNHQEMGEQFARVAQACQQIPRFGRKTALDDGVEALLPLLRTQIDQAKAKLAQAKQSLPPNSAAEIALQSFERILGAVVGYLDRVPQALALHANWQQPVDRLFLLHQQVEVV